jgi:hypothetical protein
MWETSLRTATLQQCACPMPRVAPGEAFSWRGDVEF